MFVIYIPDLSYTHKISFKNFITVDIYTTCATKYLLSISFRLYCNPFLDRALSMECSL